MDSLLAGTLFLPWEVHCACMMSSAGHTPRKHSGHRENHSGVARKLFAFPSESLFAFSPESLFAFSPESLFAFSPECFSRSSRNPVRLAPESPVDEALLRHDLEK